MHLPGHDFPFGLTRITGLSGPHTKMNMDFAVLRLADGSDYVNNSDRERAYLLVYGTVRFEWDGLVEVATRFNCFDENPWVLHVPASVAVCITGVGADSEITCHAAENTEPFAPRLYTQKDCRSEERGKGTMKETSTRIVRTVFDYTNAPFARLVIGEVIDFPGKWSSYPPHHHPQPEIYYYKFNPRGGFGYCEQGDAVVKVRHNSTALIEPGMTHPQATAPGYAMWYLWVICHLPGNPYIQPTFLPEHLWATEPDAVFWPDKDDP